MKTPGQTVLVVEDDPGFRTLLTEVLTEHGYRVRTAKNGEEAWVLLERESSPPDLILTDLLMPKMGGSDLAKKVKSDRRVGGVPIVAVSGAGAESVLDTQVDWYLAKPLELATLLKTVRHYCGRGMAAA